VDDAEAEVKNNETDVEVPQDLDIDSAGVSKDNVVDFSTEIGNFL
jgi:hypothetical protein